MSYITNFSPEKAKEFILNHKTPYVKLLLLRDIDNISINDSKFIKLQDQILQEKILSRLLAKQLKSGAWVPSDKDGGFGQMHRSTIWTLVLLGYLGLNGKIIAQISNAVDYIFDKLFQNDTKIFINLGSSWNKFMESHNASILRSLIKLGFESYSDVYNACMTHLDMIYGKEGLCEYKKGGFKCAWGLTKDLLLLNEFPKSWRTEKYNESVKACQDGLLAFNLAEANYPNYRNLKSPKWFQFMYFRSYHSDIFETIEALVGSGIKDHPVLMKALEAMGEHCIDEKTWNCVHTYNWQVKFEQKDKPSPWLSLRGLRIDDALGKKSF
ncbi:MAG: hypothetical protein ACXAC7_01410 [Candidatus Hodarchaeales archaeon]